MIYNSFNRISNYKECSGQQDQSKDKTENKPNNNEILNNKDWESKYDISIVVLQEEYLQCLNRIRNVDEKANKYLVIISIVITGFFVISSSSTIESLEFNYIHSIVAFLLTLISILTFLIGLVYGVLIFRSLLKCLDLVETKRMPNLINSLKTTSNKSCVEYKHYIIQSYQEAINLINNTLSNKQKHIIKVSKDIKYFLIFFTITLIILIILKLIG